MKLHLAEVLPRLEGVRREHGCYIAKCPCHDDRRASLSIREEYGKLLLHCFAGCSFEAIIAALDGRPWHRAPGPSRENGRPPLNDAKRSEIARRIWRETRFEVRGVDGKLIAVHVRRDAIDAVTDQTTKRMWWETPDGRRGLSGIKVKRLPLFGAHLMHEWPEELIVVAEGEKATLSLQKRDVKAVGTVSGAAAVPNDDVLRPLLRFTTIALWPDADGPGRTHMDSIAKALMRLGHRNVRMVEWSDAPAKGDAADFRGTDDQVRALIENARKIETDDDNPEDSRPEIVIIPGRRPWMVDRAEEIIIDYRRWKLFQRGGIVCRVVEIDSPDGEEEKPLSIRRPNGAVVLKTVDTITLEDILGRGIKWLRHQKGELVPADCPPKVAATYLSRVGQWRLPALTGVVEAPTVLTDGTIVDSPGYDPASGLYLYTREIWLTVPEAPSRAAAEAALRTLCEPFGEFPFVSEADRSVILSEILTGLVRRQLPPAPLHGHGAPAQGSGKSLLADCTALLLTGRPVASMPLGGDGKEIRKRITSVLLAGDLIVNIDNVVRPLKSDALAMAITQPIYADRILGRNETPQLPTNLLWIATGNNLVLAGDLTTRAIVCRIDADVERPEDRSFTITDLRTHIRRERPRLVQAGLTILRAYCLAGRPKQLIQRFGRFEEWSDWIRSALVWLGCADPCKTRDRITLNDPERAATETVLAAWYVLFLDQMVLLRDVIAELEPRDRGEKDPVVESARAALREAFLNVAASSTNPQKIDTRRLAAWCRENTDRIAGGLRLTRGDVERHKTATWRVAVSKKGDQTDSTGQISPNLNGENGSDRDHSGQVESFAPENDPSNPCDPPEERVGLDPGRIDEEGEDSVDL